MVLAPPQLTVFACETRTSGSATINTWQGVTLTPYGKGIDRDGELYYRSFPKVDAGAFDKYRRNLTVIQNIVTTPSAWICSCVGYFEDSDAGYMLWKPAELDTLQVYFDKVVNPAKRGEKTATGGGGEDGHNMHGEEEYWVVKALRLLVEIACVLQALHDQSILLVIARPSFFRVEKGLSERGGPAIRLLDMSTCENLLQRSEGQRQDRDNSSGLTGAGAREGVISTSRSDADFVINPNANGGAAGPGGVTGANASASTTTTNPIRPGMRDRRRSSRMSQADEIVNHFEHAVASRPDGRTRSFTAAVNASSGATSSSSPTDEPTDMVSRGQASEFASQTDERAKRESRKKLSRSTSRDDVLIRHHLRYLAPENTATKAPPTVLSDMYSLGVCMYELMSERVIEGDADTETRDILSDIYRHITFEIPSLNSVNDAIAASVSDMVMRCIAKKPTDRYVSFSSLRYDIKRMIESALEDKDALDGFETARVDKMARYEWLTDMQDRQVEMPMLKEVYDRTHQSGQTGIAIVYGESGSGKSMLLENWVGANCDPVDGQPMLVGWAKLDEHLVRPLSAFSQIFKSLLDMVLTDPLEDVAVWRDKIVATLAHPLDMFSSMIPGEWQDLLLKGTVLESKIGSHAVATVADFDVYQRQLHTWCRKLLLVFSEARPSVMVLVIDDVQWMSKEERSLWADLLENPARNVRNTLALGSYRTVGKNQTPAGFSSRAHLIHIKGFSLTTIRSQLETAFKWPAGDRRSVELAGILFEESKGNPLYLRTLVPVLVKQRGLFFNFESLEWEIHLGNAAVHALSGLETVISDIILSLPVGSQDALKALSCLPSRNVALSILATLLSKPVDSITSDLQIAATIGLVSVHHGLVTFCHDKQHSAALKVLSREPDAAQQRLSIARRLASIDSSDVHVFDVVNNLLAARDLGCKLDVEETVSLLLKAARKASRAAAFGTAVEYLTKIEDIVPLSSSGSWECHRELCFDLQRVWTDAAQGEKSIAPDVIAKLRRSRAFCNSVLEHLELLLLVLRLKLTLALNGLVPKLVYEAFAIAGLPVDSTTGSTTKTLESLPQNPTDLQRVAVPGPLTHGETLTDSEQDRVGILLNALATLGGPSLFSITPDQGYSVFSIAAALAFASPNVIRHAASAYSMSAMALIMCGRLQLDMASGYVRLAVQPREHRDIAYETLVDIVVTSVVHISTPLSQIDYDRSWDSATASDNAEAAAYVGALDMVLHYVRGADFTAATARGRERMKALSGQATPAGRIANAAVLQMMENLSDTERPIAALSVLEGPYLSASDGSLTESNGVYALIYYTSALVLDMVFEVGIAHTAMMAQKAREHAMSAPGLLIGLEYALTYALFTLVHPEHDDPPYRKELMDEMRTFKNSRDVQARVGLIECLEMALAYKSDGGMRFGDIIDRHDEAYALAAANSSWSIAGYISYLAARFIISVKPTSQLALGYLVSAVKAYTICGCYAVARKIRGEFPDLAELLSYTSVDAPLDLRSHVAPAKADIDTRLSLESIIRSFLVLATERDGEALLGKLLKVLLQLSRAEFCAIVLREDSSNGETLLLRAAGTYSALSIFDVPLSDAAAYCPVAPILHCAHTKTIMSDPTEINRWKRERFYRGSAPEWMLIVPLMIGGELGGVLYLDGKRQAAPASSSTEILAALGTFAALSHESIRTTRSLESAIKRRTTELQAALAAKSSFLSHMSHELRTPLFAVLGLAAVLEDSKGLDQTQREYLATIRSSGEDLQRVISGILDFSKLESGSIETERIVFDLRTVTEGVVDSLATVAQGKGVYLYVATPMDEDPLFKLLGDPYRIRQCLLNLVGNAIKFTPGTGKVMLTWDFTEKDGKVLIGIEVSDTGPGVPADKTDRLFKSFSQVDSTISRTYEGSGLGLAITKSLSQLMGGDCTFRPAPGGGAIFRLTVEVDRSEESTGHVINRGGTRTQRHAIVATQDPWRDVLVANLKSIGIECYLTGVHKADVYAVLERHAAKKFDYILLDDVSLSGEELAELRRTESKAELVQLSLRRSGDPDPSFTRTLVKPVKAVALCQAFVSDTDSRGGIGKPEQKPSSTAMDKTLASRAPLHILFCDDNRVNCMVGTKILQRFGYTNVERCYNGQEAVNAARMNDFDLILLDLQMPVMDGFTAMAEMRKRSGPHALVVALTAHSDVATKEKCLGLGFWDFLAKPLEISSLKKVLERAHGTLGSKRGERAEADEAGPDVPAKTGSRQEKEAESGRRE